MEDCLAINRVDGLHDKNPQLSTDPHAIDPEAAYCWRWLYDEEEVVWDGRCRPHTSTKDK